MTIPFDAAIRGPLAALPAFARPDSWAAWAAYDRAVLGQPLRASELDLFRRLTGRSTPRAGGYREAVSVTGRRSGKTEFHGTRLALDAVALEDGRGVFFVVLAQDARAALRAAMAPIQRAFSSLAFRELVAHETQDSIELTSGAVVAVYPARPAAVRGITLAGAYLDELAFMISTEGRPVDVEMLRAVRPALATTGGRLYISSSPYAQSGALWDLYRKHHGARLVGQSSTVVLRASAPEMNGTLPADYLERMAEDDPEAYRSEVLGEFRAGLSALLEGAAIDACVVPGVREVPRRAGVRYSAHFDASSGRGDRAALAIGHAEGGRVVLDVLRAWNPPFDPEAVVADAARVAREYGALTVQVDRYAAGFVVSAFARHGLTARVAERTTSEHHLELVPLVNSKRASLLDHPELLRELRGLERRVSRTGKDSVDHRPGGHDDCAAAVSGVLSILAKKGSRNPAAGIIPMDELRREERAERPRSVDPSWVELAPGVWGPEGLRADFEEESA